MKLETTVLVEENKVKLGRSDYNYSYGMVCRGQFVDQIKSRTVRLVPKLYSVQGRT